MASPKSPQHERESHNWQEHHSQLEHTFSGHPSQNKKEQLKKLNEFKTLNLEKEKKFN